MPQTKLDAGGLVVAASAALVLSYAVCLGIWFIQHRWILDSDGKPIFTDFAAIWTSGRLALQGAALAAYDGHALHAAEAAAIGHGFQGYLGWPYPPLFFFIAAALGSLPYAPAFLAWSLATLTLYAATIFAVMPSRVAILVACAAPWVAADLTIGQNGFFTAALVGIGLLAMDKRPMLCGLALALLTYKPQFGLLIPIALAADGQWRVIASAAIWAAILFLLAGAVFGFDTYGAFLRGLPQTAHTLVVNGAVGWNKLQSPYGAARWIGASDGVARGCQILVSLLCAGGVAWLWRRKGDFNLKAAALSAAALLATPYVFFYDFPVLAVAIAFLYRQRAFDRAEMTILAAGLAGSLAFVMLTIPLGLLTIAGVLAIVLRRAFGARPSENLDRVALQRG